LGRGQTAVIFGGPTAVRALQLKAQGLSDPLWRHRTAVLTYSFPLLTHTR